VKISEIPLCQLKEAPWNANKMDVAMLSHLQESISRYGIVENLVVRKLQDETFEVISGNQRLNALREAGYQEAPCQVVDLNDTHARLLAQALNHIQGQDDLGLRAELLRHVLAELPEKEVLAILPETAVSLQGLISLGTETIANYLQNKQIAQAARLKHLQFQLTPSQLDLVEEAITKILSSFQEAGADNPNIRGNALYLLCKAYLEKEKLI
jgi:ParB family chromosome partitioning protein